MLYRPETFEPLTEEPWDETRVRAAIRSIVADAEAAFDPDSLWPADEWDAWQARLPLTSLYVGAAGVVWALDDRRGALGQRLAGQRRRALAAARCGRPLGESTGRSQPGAAHGVGTNVNALLQGGELFPSERHEELKRPTAEAFDRTAVVEDGLANWPMTAEDYPNLAADDGEIRLQWCHGGAGVVASAAAYLEEELLLAGAELVWRAGPPGMEKGLGICHGTAGNGYALLKVFERTSDERWLARARRFAVHALGQVERRRAKRGRGRYSLFTGDIGPALFAADCLDSRTAVPIVDAVDW